MNLSLSEVVGLFPTGAYRDGLFEHACGSSDLRVWCRPWSPLRHGPSGLFGVTVEGDVITLRPTDAPAEGRASIDRDGNNWVVTISTETEERCFRWANRRRAVVTSERRLANRPLLVPFGARTAVFYVRTPAARTDTEIIRGFGGRGQQPRRVRKVVSTYGSEAGHHVMVGGSSHGHWGRVAAEVMAIHAERVVARFAGTVFEEDPHYRRAVALLKSIDYAPSMAAYEAMAALYLAVEPPLYFFGADGRGLWRAAGPDDAGAAPYGPRYWAVSVDADATERDWPLDELRVVDGWTTILEQGPGNLVTAGAA